jgi:hypothetical protein
MKAFERNFLLRFILFIYIYIASTIYGWQILCFILSYLSGDMIEIHVRLIQWSQWQFFIILIGMVATLINGMVLYFNWKSIKSIFNRLKSHFIGHSIFLLLLLINYVLLGSDWHVHLVELILIALALYLLIKTGWFFYQTRRNAWFHPTTYGGVFVSALLQGFAWILLLNPFEIDLIDLSYWILICLGFDLLILYARFRYLSRFNPETNKIARKLLGPYILFFGSRIIVGIFMPVVYVLYAIFISDITIRGTGILLLAGTFLQSMLFVCVVEEKPYDGVMV